MAQALKDNFIGPAQPIRALEDAAKVNPFAAEYLAALEADRASLEHAAFETEKASDKYARVLEMLSSVGDVRDRIKGDHPKAGFSTLEESFNAHVTCAMAEYAAGLDGKKIAAIGKNVKFMKPSQDVVRAVDEERSSRRIFDPAQSLG